MKARGLMWGGGFLLLTAKVRGFLGARPVSVAPRPVKISYPFPPLRNPFR